VFPPDLKRQNVAAFSLATDTAKALSFEDTQSQRLKSCAEMLPFSIGIVSPTESRIQSAVVKLATYRGSALSTIGFTMMNFGTTSSRLLIVSPVSAVNDFLNPTPSPSTRNFNWSLCAETAGGLRVNEPGARRELTLDSITFADNTVIGEDTYGVVKRSEKRLEALQNIMPRIAAENASPGQLQQAMASILVATQSAREASPRDPQDFYALELHAIARSVLFGLKSGNSSQEIEQSLKRHLESNAKQEVLKRRSP